MDDCKRKYTFRQRKPAAVKRWRPKKSARLLDPMQAVDVLAAECCKKQCVQRLTLEQLMRVRHQSEAVSERSVSEALIAELRASLDAAREHVTYRVLGMEVCRTAWMWCHGVSKGKIDRCLELARSDRSLVLSGNSSALRPTDVSDQVYAWLSNYFEDLCDKPSDELWVLPAHLNWTSIHQELVEELKKSHATDTAPSYSTFCHVRKHVRSIVRMYLHGTHSIAHALAIVCSTSRL